jgi:uncharacterized membrane protein
MRTNGRDSIMNRAPRWLIAFAVLGGLFVGLPWLAPLLMHWGWSAGGNAIYFAYSFVCHQLPERSYFLFGEKLTYGLSEIRTVWPEAANPMILRQFTGTPHMGWKVAWSDRMVSMYTSLWLTMIGGWMLRRRLPTLPLWGLVLLALPMVVDGSSHLVSDVAGIGRGFRDANLWLTVLTANRLSAIFYAGDAWGSFNSLMRLVTGLLFGGGVAWFGVPYLSAFEIKAEPSAMPNPALVNLSPIRDISPKGQA